MSDTPDPTPDPTPEPEPEPDEGAEARTWQEQRHAQSYPTVAV